MGDKRRISAKEAEQVGATLGLDWKQIDIEQFRRGLKLSSSTAHATRRRT